MPIRAAHEIAARLDELALNETIPGLGPDGNVQVTVEYEDNVPARIDALVIQAQHQGNVSDFREGINGLVLDAALERFHVGRDSRTRVVLNAEGPWLVGGPARNAGHTGRKQATDTYGGAARHGDGALSGKDPGRMDRCAAYAARYVAKNVVAAGLSPECEVMLSYAIGDAQPTTVFCRTFSYGRLSDERLSALVRETFDLRPAAIATKFGLWMLPSENGGRFYRRLAEHGQVGRTDIELPWEAVDAAELLVESAGAASSV
jgi:S-adenosylmethionine synthetase